jgi:glutathione peroxidase-family protein
MAFFVGVEIYDHLEKVVDRSGKVVGRYAPTVTPEGLRREIEALL